MRGNDAARLSAALAPPPRDMLLLKAAFADDAAFDEAYGEWSAAVGGEPALTSYNLLQLLTPRLRDRSGLDPLVKLCRQQYRLVWAKAMIQERRHAAIYEAFARRSIPLIVLKGPALRRYYGDKGLRTPGDLDILVPIARLRDAIDLQASCGATAIAYRDPRTFDPRFDHALTYIMPDQELVDLHVHAVHDLVALQVDGPLIWSAARAFEIGGVTVLTPAPEHHLLMQIDHRFNEPLGSSRWIADCLMVIRSGEVDWGRLVRDAATLGMTRVAGAALSLLSDMGATVPADVLDTLTASDQSIRWPPALSKRLSDRVLAVRRMRIIWAISGQSPHRFVAAVASFARMWVGRRLIPYKLGAATRSFDVEPR